MLGEHEVDSETGHEGIVGEQKEGGLAGGVWGGASDECLSLGVFIFTKMDSLSAARGRGQAMQ